MERGKQMWGSLPLATYRTQCPAAVRIRRPRSTGRKIRGSVVAPHPPTACGFILITPTFPQLIHLRARSPATVASVLNLS